MPEETLLLVGLGNPGEKYKNNRHNVGFIVLDYITNHLKFGRSRTKFLGRTSMGTFEKIKLISFSDRCLMPNKFDILSIFFIFSVYVNCILTINTFPLYS